MFLISKMACLISLMSVFDFSNGILISQMAFLISQMSVFDFSNGAFICHLNLSYLT